MFSREFYSFLGKCFSKALLGAAPDFLNFLDEVFRIHM